MRPDNIKKMVTAALFAAIICVATLSPYATPGGGFIHLGDSFVLIAGWILGPLWGAAAAAVGSSLTDLILGYAVYAPATFIIKGAMAAIAFYVMSLISGRGRSTELLKYALGAISGEAVMVAGYFAYELFLYGAAGAAGNIVFNLIQGGAGIVISSLIIHPLMRISYLSEIGGSK